MRFYVLRESIGSDAETSYETVGRVNLGNAPQCPECGSYIGMRPWLPPYKARIRAYGARLGDVAFGAADDLLLSERFVSAWHYTGLTGIETSEPVEVVSITPRKLPGTIQSYFHAAVPRAWATRVDEAASEIIRDGKIICRLCGEGSLLRAILALRLDEASWSGEDVFTPWGLCGITVVTEHVLALAEDFGLLNVTTVPLEDYRSDPLLEFGGPRRS